MGIIANLRAKAEPQVQAAYETPIFPNYFSALIGASYVTRQQAMQVPAVARARNIICGTIGAMPINRWSIPTNTKQDSIPLQYAPDPDVQKSVTYSYIADSMLFFGVAYVQVLEQSADGRVSRFRWISNERITGNTNAAGTEIISYTLDGGTTPQSGIGSIKAILSPDQGILTRAGRTIQTAIELEEAANRAAKEPAPNVIMIHHGVPMVEAKVTQLLEKWKSARRERSTAFVNGGEVDVKAFQFNPAEQQLVEARQFHASEIARACGIPAWYLNAETASMTYSNTEQERRSLIDFSLKPYLRAIEERLSMRDFLPDNLEFRFDLDDFLRGSSEEQMRVITGYTAAEILSVNEARELIDLSPRGATSEPSDL
jgi:HK97 family phage portal protein